jgi:hypothetical protein
MSNKIKKNVTIQVAPLMLALLIFFESTAGNLRYLVHEYKIFNTAKNNTNTSSNLVQTKKSGALTAPVQQDPQAGGPDQPEVQSFTPIGISDMVDPFTGDFSYNIPIMDVDGYPINLAYNGGANMDQEASWVGLGWNLNPGVMNRSLRGLPDDFNGSDSIETAMNQKKNWTMGVNLGLDFELFGLTLPENSNYNIDSASLSVNLNIDYDNFQGYSASFCSNPFFNFENPAKKISLDAGWGFSGSSAGGASLSPSLDFSNQGSPVSPVSLRKLNIGATLNSRQGLKVNAGFPSILLTSKTQNHKARLALKTAQKLLNFSSKYISTSSFNIGNVSFSPKVNMPINMFSTAFSVKFGPDAAGTDPSVTVGASYSSSWLKYNKYRAPAFGYNYLGNGQQNSRAQLDFTRENDGAITKNTPALAIPSLNYDIFSASGHGVGGSYRPTRNEIGFVFDPMQQTNSLSTDFDFETNIGSVNKVGLDVSLVRMSNKSGVWEDFQNQAIRKMQFSKDRIKYQEANELSVDNDIYHFEGIGGFNAVKFDYSLYQGIRNKLETDNGTQYDDPNYVKSGKIKRNQLTSTLSNFEVRQEMGIQRMHPSNYAFSRPKLDHHVGQFTVLNTEGSRYVYGIAAYNHYQSNVSFSVGDFNNSTYVENSNGMVKYEIGSDNSLANSKGTENYFNKETTPAYAHSYLLTSVLNADYVDADTMKGPSSGDLGGYLKLDYFKVDNYQWRTPIVGDGFANYEEGFHTDDKDDKGHYSYGEKEMWYLTAIRSKNHVAVFHTSARADGNAMDSNGVLITTGVKMMKLDSISLFSAPDYDAQGVNATPIKVAHFVYDYSLCKNYPLNSNTSSSDNGKLTLKKVYFTYERSHKGRFSAYRFKYDYNPNYHPKSVDRWGNYKPYPTNYSGNVFDDPLRPSDYPYVDFNKANVDFYASAWNLTDILLPSGGKIEVKYESDDYAYVQHKRANQMFKIIGVEKEGGVTTIGDEDLSSLLLPNIPNAKLYFELLPDGNGGYHTNISDYIPEDKMIYFRALMKFNDNRYDFVPGFAEIDNISISSLNGQPAGVIQFKPAKLKDYGAEIYNPIAVAGIQFGRINLTKFIPPSNNLGDANNTNPIGGVVDAIVGAFSSYAEFFTGPNAILWAQNVGTNIRVQKSWIRLQNPNQKKLGGGYRVKEVKIYDSWDTLTNNLMAGFYYGQEFSYLDKNGNSSGVAAYEPQAGSDENPFQQPLYFTKRHILAPNEQNFQQLPLGEQFFPTAQVGYSSVTIRNLQRTNVTKTATGKVVHEFYTAKDFPTIVARTKLKPNPNRIRIPTYFFNFSVDQLVVSQGFVIETNDMHGKPKGEYIYAEGQTSPQSSVEYKYKSQNYEYDGKIVKRLINKVTTISKSGTVNNNSRIGLQYEAFADFRKSLSQTVNAQGQFNVNFTIPIPIVPSGYSQYGYERTALRSATFTKVIERFGLLDTTIATDDKSIVRTENLAYDSETGAVILSKTQTDFNDAVYNLTIPAHWYYDRMGQAYINLDYEASNVNFVSGGSSQLNNAYLVKGDEILLKDFNGNESLAWVTDLTGNGAKLQYKDGSLVSGSFQNIRVIRSGRRNTQMTPVGTITLRSNPLNTIASNFYDNVLQASATEFTEDWRTFCDCFAGTDSSHLTTNPFVRGTKGTWRPSASFVHLTDRTQAYDNQNTNIRDDGFMTSFSPFFKFQNGGWNVDRQNWTFTSKVSEFSPFGQALEAVDPLNRYTASQFGYNQTLAIAVAANARYRQIGYDGFEDYAFENCSDNHFNLAGNFKNKLTKHAHTGKYAIKVSATDNVSFTKIIETGCDVSRCNILKNDNIVNNSNGTTTQTVTFSNGQAPYQMDITVVNGTPNYLLNSDGNGIIIPNSTTSYIINIQVIDVNGCIQNFQVKK